MATDAGDLVLRPAEPDDLPGVAELFWATRAAAVPAMPPVVQDRGEVRAWVTGWSLGPGEREVWIAEDGLGLSGFATVHRDWLEALYVEPGRQGGGIGSALLEVVMGVRPRGFGLWVFASNGPARGFYRRHGLIELEHTDGSGNDEHAPDVRMAWLGEDPVDHLRREIDAVDDELGVLMARRFALTAAVQGHKRGAGTDAGHAGRDVAREREIVERMARHAPGLPPERLAPIMHAVIGEGLSAWEQQEARQ